MAAAGAAVALYFSYKRATTAPGSEASLDAPSTPTTVHFKDAHQAPNTYLESLYFFAEALRYSFLASPFPTNHIAPLQKESACKCPRYMYSESLGRWRTADLLIGLAYLARREGQEHPVADIASKAQPIGKGHASAPEQGDVLVCFDSTSLPMSCRQLPNLTTSRMHVCYIMPDCSQHFDSIPDHLVKQQQFGVPTHVLLLRMHFVHLQQR